jgi:hypothetical protein
MNLPEPVLRDLLTVVLSGESSPESRRIVDDYALEHPEFARLLQSNNALVDIFPPQSPDREMESLKRTKEMLRLKSILLGMALAFSLLPLSFVFRNGVVTFFLVRDATGAAIGLWSVAAASWVAYFVIARSLRTTGL